MKEIAQVLTAEQGKTLADAEGDIQRGLEKWNHGWEIKRRNTCTNTQRLLQCVSVYTTCNTFNKSVPT
jgi:malonate-semialdehyde dehydrogenase (acetylating)/methylmalonate-semialdehyde dehydrogenase